MKILMTLSDMDRFWTHRAELARAIVGRGWDLAVATEGAERDAGLAAMGARGLPWPPHKNFLSHFSILRHMWSLLRSERPDMVHAVTLRHSFYMACAMRFIRRDIPCVYTIAGLGSLFSAPTPAMRIMRPAVVVLMRRVLAGKRVFMIFQNEENRDAFVGLGIVRPSQTILIRGSGVDIKQFQATPEPQEGEPIVLYAGRLLKDKGLFEFVEAARIVRASGIAARFVMAGDFYLKNPHSLDPALVRGWADEGIIEWNGPSDDMPATLRAATLAVLPSYHEGLPKFLLEAAASARAIVATDIAGCREIVRDGHNGLLVPVRDANALAAAVCALLADPDHRRTMGENGRKLVEDEFAVEGVVSQTLGVYDRATGDTP